MRALLSAIALRSPSAVPDCADPRRSARRWFWLVAAALVCGAFFARLGDHRIVVRPEAVTPYDNDTLRWLAHLEARDHSPGYPLREVQDGFPEGTEIHWTLPMEWILRGLDPLVRWVLPQARKYEAAAVLAGPLLACVALLVFLGLARRLLGDPGALLAGAFYTLGNPVLSVSWLGNGDHQNLQHLLLLASVLAWLRRCEGLGGRGLAWLAGAALGGAVWVSTESMLLVQLLCAVAFVQVTWMRRGLPPEHLRDELARAVALLGVLVVAQTLEQTSPWAVTWDKVSWFTTHQAAVFLAFLLLVWKRVPAVAAAGVAVAVGLGVLWLVPGYVAAVQGELARFAAANAWVQTCVEEYHAAFSYRGGFSWQAGMQRLSWCVVALPVLGIACARDAARSPAFRVALLLLVAGTFALALWESKLAHLFGICFPLLLVRGAQALGGELARRSPALLRPARVAFVVAGLAAARASRPAPRTALTRRADQGVAELCRVLAERTRGRDARAVLAPWELGAPLMRDARVPVVASGYHRNLEGIRDAYRAYLAQPGDGAALRALLHARRVRYVVVWFDRMFLEVAPQIAGVDGTAFERNGDEVRVTPFAQQSLYWRLRFGVPVPGFSAVYASRLQVELQGTGPMPLFVLYEWAE